MRYAPGVAIAVAPLLLLLIATASAAETGGADDPDAARDNQRIILDCTMRCVTEAMGCATTCAGARPDEAPVCAAACVQSDIGCLAGCRPPQPGPDQSSPPAPVPPAA
jgi:WASH complex subunit strumpellin